MKTHESLSISIEDYNTALFEVGCIIAEDQYSYFEATQIKTNKMYWMWLRNQQRIVDMHFERRLKMKEFEAGSKRAFDVYYNMLFEHISVVYFPEKLKNKMINKSKKS